MASINRSIIRNWQRTSGECNVREARETANDFSLCWPGISDPHEYGAEDKQRGKPLGRTDYRVCFGIELALGGPCTPCRQLEGVSRDSTYDSEATVTDKVLAIAIVEVLSVSNVRLGDIVPRSKGREYVACEEQAKWCV